ncbi:cysteine-rich repeat secretory protein 55 [Cynara cardunculus var. scolymus]|uniref:Gnk2-homologous domain-containing protein n=1 Tax=Cynara cardunculus var. scolymus TaxID=59895 RepID=A0A103XNU1_CYNCS|nr:cysteine-rich repeat secretory protein 55 [Cynara cardunculus var. scolymus]KVH94204.1 Gnk2-homologous domain-containing protein [Cynara cardunculus var. scolymus]
MAFFYHHLLIFTLCILYVESADPSAQLCNENSNTTTTELTRNINSLLPKLVQATSQLGYSATSFGYGRTQVFGLAQCRGDVSSQDCSSCIQEAANEIRKMCPNRIDARIWYEYCFLRYNNENFIGQLDTGYGTFYYNVQNVTDPEKFNEGLGALMYRISSLAAVAGSKGLGKGQTKLTPFSTLYGLVQCTRDLSELSCRQCLAIAIGNLPTYCDNKKGCRVIYSSCYVRYELYPFFFPLDSEAAHKSLSMANYKSIVTKT